MPARSIVFKPIRALHCATLFSMLLAPPLYAQRGKWEMSGVHGSPEPPQPYRVERAFPKLTFYRPLDAVRIPGTDRLVIVEQHGRLFSIPNDETAAQPDLFADLKKFEPETFETYGIAFHPQFAKNRFAYVWIVLDLHNKPTRDEGTLIVRFRVAEENPPRLDFATGQTVFSWLAGGHNGGNVRFGPDGMLYLSTGDAANPDPPDARATGQDISDLLSSVLRIDVDHPDPGKTYGIPKDNPFITAPGARGEVWAYGFRNPWRLSFDPKTGALWVADVGWELWEMIDRVERGGNYGWSITEGGRQDVRPDRVRGPTPILPPAVAHSHEEAASITGGEVYYGTRLPELAGSYIYGDWQFGTFWALRDGTSRQLCRSTLMPAGFGTATDGELLICDHGGGGLWRFVSNPVARNPLQFPHKLSETGLFHDIEKQEPSSGVFPYAVNAERWADHATSERWIAIPSEENVGVAKKEFGVIAPGRWVFPTDTVFAKTYTLQMERWNSKKRRRIETQLLHFDGLQWAAYSYRWNDAQTDAELVPADGAEVGLKIKDAEAPGGERHQTWRFFSRTECIRCHNLRENFVPGFSSFQLNRTVPDGRENQFGIFQLLGLVPADAKPEEREGDRSALEIRARSYLHANCAVCHRQDGGGAVPSRMNFQLPLGEARLVGAKPVQGDLALPEGRIIAPGDPARSVLLYRITTAGRGHMPYLGGKLVDDRGVIAVRDWIAGMDPERDLSAALSEQREREAKSLAQLISGDTAPLENLLSTASGALSVALAVIDGSLKGSPREQAIAKGSALADPLRRDLFERFLPDAQRRKVLGPDIRPDAILARKGDAPRGKALFTAICAACHHAGDTGIDFGPDLTHIATKFDRIKLLEQILDPAKLIEPPWELATITLGTGGTETGFIAERTGADVTLKIAGGTRKKLTLSESNKIKTERISLMPPGLLQGLTAQEAADLLEFLTSLK